jgi:hypothetical protein
VPPAWNTPADNGEHEATMCRGGKPEAFACDSAIRYLVEGENILAIEVHNASSSSSDLTCIPYLSIGSLQKTAEVPPSILELNNPVPHLNFKINASGDSLYLTHPSGTLVDSLILGPMEADISTGRKPDGSGSWYWFQMATPGGPNITTAFPVQSSANPVFSHAGGFQTGPVDLTITGASLNDSIWYTTNGADPTRLSNLYNAPIHLDTSTVIKAIITGPGRMIRKPVTRSYLFRNAKPNMVIVSLSTDPNNFFNWDTGIYAMGPNAQSAIPNWGANFWQDWERPVHLELYEKDGSIRFETDAGIKIFGAWSRSNPQRSFAFFARNRYGNGKFDYPLFPDLPFIRYNNFLLRNSGNDWNKTMFRDAMITSLPEEGTLDHMAYRPTAVYLNGTYWGLLNLREKINEHFLSMHHGYDPMQIDLLEWNASVISGDNEHYTQMINFLTHNSPSNKTNYDRVKTMMNIENFMEYTLTEIFCGNADWPGNNIKYWRPRTPNGRWRWIIFDTDFGFCLWDDVKLRYDYNTLAFALSPNGDPWPNPPWSTFLLRRLMESTEFRNEFINRFADRLNTVFTSTAVLQRINQMSSAIESEIPYHLARWNQWGETLDTWKYYVDVMRNYASNRVSYARQHISSQFSNLEYANLTLQTSSAQSGAIQLNTLLLHTFPWTGVYFKIPVRLTAKPNPGYRFVRWEGPVDAPLSPSTTLTLTRSSTVKAIFEEDGSGLNHVVINEIYYNDPPDFDADDWVELYNNGTSAVDLSGWFLRDSDTSHRFELPPGSLLYPGEYLVVCQNASDFKTAYPDAADPAGDLPFGLSSQGDCIYLYSSTNALVDSVPYGITDPWPDEPATLGLSIELIHPAYNNALGINWTASASPHGSPGAHNSTFTGTNENELPESPPEPFLEVHPNPVSLFSQIRYEVSASGNIRLLVYNLQGHCVKTLFEGFAEPGMQVMPWDACDNLGAPLAPGVYICVLETPGQTVRCRIVVLRTQP